ncbi:tetratricopeptide repeat protein [Arenibacterium sp. CAU 1754]
MRNSGVTRRTPVFGLLTATAVLSAVAACVPERIELEKGGPFPPGVDHRKKAVDGVEVGHRLMSAAQYELAIEAFTRAALEQGMTPEILSGLGTANLGLGRLGQAEDLLRKAVRADANWPAAWNNLGVVLMERGKTTEAEQVFRKAYALDDGQSDSIRDNLRLALAKSEISANDEAQNEEYKLVQRGNADYLIRRNQD